MEEDEKAIDTEPFNVIFSPTLYHAIKYNQGLKPNEDMLSDSDKREFEIFKNLFKSFLFKLNKHDQGALSTLSSLMQMWGYTRKYCGMCGKPVIGKGGLIHSRLVCPTCYGSYEITEALYKKEHTSADEKRDRQEKEKESDN